MTNMVNCLGVFLDEAKALSTLWYQAVFWWVSVLLNGDIFNLKDKEMSAVQKYENAESLFFTIYDKKIMSLSFLLS